MTEIDEIKGSNLFTFGKMFAWQWCEAMFLWVRIILLPYIIGPGKIHMKGLKTGFLFGKNLIKINRFKKRSVRPNRLGWVDKTSDIIQYLFDFVKIFFKINWHIRRWSFRHPVLIYWSRNRLKRNNSLINFTIPIWARKKWKKLNLPLRF